MWWNLHSGIALLSVVLVPSKASMWCTSVMSRGAGAVGPGAAVPLGGDRDSLSWAVEPVGVAGVDGGGAGEDDWEGSRGADVPFGGFGADESGLTLDVGGAGVAVSASVGAGATSASGSSASTSTGSDARTVSGSRARSRSRIGAGSSSTSGSESGTAGGPECVGLNVDSNRWRSVAEQFHLVDGAAGGAGGEIHDLDQGVYRELVVGARVIHHVGRFRRLLGVDEARSTAAR